MCTDDISMNDTHIVPHLAFNYFFNVIFFFVFVFWVCETSSHIRRHGKGWISEHHEH
jgi:hypothetical protein